MAHAIHKVIYELAGDKRMFVGIQHYPEEFSLQLPDAKISGGLKGKSYETCWAAFAMRKTKGSGAKTYTERNT